MKKNIIFTIIGLGLLALGIFRIDVNQIIFIWDYPFKIIGEGLRNLSLTSNFLNIISIIIYLLVCLSPVAILYFHIKNKSLRLFEIIILPILSFLSFITIYYMINPLFLYNNLNDLILNNASGEQLFNFEEMIRSGFVTMLYLVIIIYIAFRIYNSQNIEPIKMVIAVLDLIIFVVMVSVLMVAVKNMLDNLSINGNSGYDRTLTILNFSFDTAINFATIYLLILFKRFIREIHVNGFDQTIIDNIKKIRKFSFMLVVFILSTQFLTNSFQFLFLKKFNNYSFTMNLPIFALLISIIGFIFGEYFKRVKELNEDSSLII